MCAHRLVLWTGNRRFLLYNQGMLLGGIIFFFLFGAIAGSFLNVLTLRSGARPLSGRSRCLSCGKTLAWFELIPLVSFFLQMRRCRGCQSRISWQYPLIECVTGLVFVGIYYRLFVDGTTGASTISNFQFPISNEIGMLFVVALHLIIWSVLIALAVYDLRHKIIPDVFVYGLIFLSFLSLLISYSIFHISSLLDFWGGPFFALALAAVWFFSRGRAIGLGDAKLVLGMGWFLGFVGGLSAFILGFWLGALYAIAALLLRFVSSRISLCPELKSRLKNLTMKSELPLAPFLIAGTLIVYLTGVDVTGLGILLKM